MTTYSYVNVQYECVCKLTKSQQAEIKHKWHEQTQMHTGNVQHQISLKEMEKSWSPLCIEYSPFLYWYCMLYSTPLFAKLRLCLESHYIICSIQQSSTLEGIMYAIIQCTQTKLLFKVIYKHVSVIDFKNYMMSCAVLGKLYSKKVINYQLYFQLCN